LGWAGRNVNVGKTLQANREIRRDDLHSGDSGYFKLSSIKVKSLVICNGVGWGFKKKTRALGGLGPVEKRDLLRVVSSVVYITERGGKG